MNLRDLWNIIKYIIILMDISKEEQRNKEQEKSVKKPKNIDLYIQEAHEFTAG